MRTERDAARENIAENRKAMHDYHLLESFEAGIALQGTEAKSIREGRVNLRDSYAQVAGGQVFHYNGHISPYNSPYNARGYAEHEPTRKRELAMPVFGELTRHQLDRVVGSIRAFCQI